MNRPSPSRPRTRTILRRLISWPKDAAWNGLSPRQPAFDAAVGGAFADFQRGAGGAGRARPVGHGAGGRGVVARRVALVVRPRAVQRGAGRTTGARRYPSVRSVVGAGRTAHAGRSRGAGTRDRGREP